MKKFNFTMYFEPMIMVCIDDATDNLNFGDGQKEFMEEQKRNRSEGDGEASQRTPCLLRPGRGKIRWLTQISSL